MPDLSEEERALINRAKQALIDAGMSEDEAHRYMIRKAMDLRIRKSELAIRVIYKGGQI